MAVLYSQPTRPSAFTCEQDQTLFKLKGLGYNSQYTCKIYYKGNNMTKRLLPQCFQNQKAINKHGMENKLPMSLCSKIKVGH